MGWPGATDLQRGVGGNFEVTVVEAPDGLARHLVKRPAPWLRDRPEGKAALEREWRVLEAMALSSMPKPLFRGEDERGPFVAESLVPGVPLRVVAEKGRPLSPARFRRLAHAAFSALAELHEHADERGPLGFVHGDISPDNLFLDEVPAAVRVGFVDFAHATFRDAQAPVFPHARGTLPYAAPELVRGEASPTAATDVYALAASLLTLVLPALTEASTEAAMLVEVGDRGLRLDAWTARQDVEPSVKQALARTLAFDPAERITSARELAAAFAPSPADRGRC